MPLISVIFPIYNCGEQLRKAIDSIVNQSFRDFEIILVDDGSNDGVTAGICDEYAAKYDYIKVCHGPNGGISVARNKGLDLAEGEYIAFMDGDDWAMPDLLERLLEYKHCDMVTSRAEGKDLTRLKPEEFKAGDVEDLFRIMHLKGLYVTWANLYKKSIIQKHGLRFNTNLRLGEDTIFNYQYLACCDTLGYVPKPLYHYTGVWGGDPDRYIFPMPVVQYRLRCGLQALRELQQHWGGEFPIQSRLSYMDHLSGRYTEYSDVDLCRAFLEACPIMSEEEYFKDRRICMSARALRELKMLWRRGKRKEVLEIAKTLRGHFTKPLSELSMKSKYRLMYTLIVREQYRLLAFLMPILSL